ncbi:MAG: lamin tail domain-containing protein [Akkermansiaceae bacterium]
MIKLPSLIFTPLIAVAAAQISSPVISEFMASNRGTLALGDESSPDWIEIHNSSERDLDLEGWHLTDDPNDPTKWTFPFGTTLASDARLLVYATNDILVGPDLELHANFKLSDQGEYLALTKPNGTVHQQFSPTYPKQYSDVSYGLRSGEKSYGYFQAPTPGEKNNGSVLGFVKDTTFSHKRGFYEEAFQLEVTTATPGATLRYTLDGSDPGPTSPQVAAPTPNDTPVLSLTIDTNTVVRALAEKPGFERTNTDTQTYLFVDQVMSHSNMSPTITGNAKWGPQMRDALLEIPSISLVTQEEVPTSPIMSPPEIPVSIEMFFPDGREGFQLDAGIERFGGQYTLYPKHALRVSFKSKYGPKRLKYDLFSETEYGGDTAVDSFDQILLRNGSHDSIFSHHYSHSRGTYIRSRYFFDRQLEEGHPSMRGRFVHVYLNGEYYGQFHLMERPNADFMATHLGGEEEDYDIMKGRSGIFVSQGEATAWNHMVANKNNYGVIEDYMDIDSYIDYMLLNFYGGNEHDWYPQHNWVAGRKREAGGKFKFFMWDNDFLNRRGGNSSTGSTANTTDNGGPGNLISALIQHEEFKIRLADRAQKHFFNGGMLTPERVKADFTKLAQGISRTVIPETARWAATAQEFESRNGFYTPDSFQRYVDWIVNVNAETRSNVVIGQMRSARMFPNIDAPAFNQHGGRVSPGFGLAMTNEAGKIYYTTDGSDPRLTGGGMNPAALEFPGEARIFTSISAGSNWKYSDSGDLGSAWKAPDFDDSAWASGAAPLGFGRINGTTIATSVNRDRHLTFYCRRTFEITDVSSVHEALLDIHADGGAIVYVNGMEVVRDNMPEGVIGFSTGSIDDGVEGEFDTFSFDPNLLIEGTNTIAVEVHNRTVGSGDMVFDLSLSGSRPLTIDSTTTVRARSLDGTTWSALSEATFLAGVPATPENLVISKIHYHPDDGQGELSEYIELMNLSNEDVNLAGVAFTQGITFTFDEQTTLAPGQRAVLVADVTAFEAAFGNSAIIIGTYPSRLANGGEQLTMIAADGALLHSVRFSDRNPWPGEPDGLGYSLTLVSPNSAPNHSLPENWRTSLALGGSPGASDSIPFTGDPETDLFTYALGDPSAIVLRTVEKNLVLEFPRILGADDVSLRIEVSSDLKNWQNGGATLLSQSARAGNRVVTQWALSPTLEDRKYVRVIVSLNH